jgi:preprotein translocase subunit SecF
MFDFYGKRYFCFAFSILILIGGVIGFIVHGGFNLDIQFKGGTVINIEMSDNKFDTTKIENAVTDHINKKVTAQKSETPGADGKSSMYVLKLSVADELTTEDSSKIVNFLTSSGYSVKKDTTPEIDIISPAIGKELRNNALLAAFIASILIILYIWWRFKAVSGLSAGVSGVIALFHDALVMLAVYTIFNIPLNESFIAAVLTILGYSMNDTVIIFDRIRENNRLLRKVPIPELVNKSIMQTLNRTINTSVTVMMSVIIVYGFAFYYGIESVKEFTFPLMIGLLSGTYSSIFIACPLFVMWKERSAKKAASAKPAKA